jgi:hypothetical protein
MPLHPSIPACSRCHDRVGVYEPFWLQLADGTLRSSSYLNLHRDLPPGQNLVRLWHRGCAGLEDVFGSAER